MESDKKYTTSGEPQKKTRKWYWRVIALILAVAMVITSIAYNRLNGEIGELMQASFREEGEKVAIDPKTIEANIDAIKKAKVIQKKLNSDYEKVQTCVSEGKYAEAVEPAEGLYEYLADDKQLGTYLRTTLGQLYFMTADYTKCAKICKDIIKRGEDPDGSVLFMRGIAQMQIEDYGGAIESLEACLAGEYPQTAMCKAQLALAYTYQEDYDKAGTYADEVLSGEYEEELAEILHYIKAISLLQKAEYEQALETFDRLLEINTAGEYYNYRALAEMATEKYEEAIADYGKALEIGYEQTSVYYNKAICHLSLGQYEEMTELLKIVVERGDDEDYTASANQLLELVGDENVTISLEN